MAKTSTTFLVCPTCEPDAEDDYDDLTSAMLAYQDAADATCWRCEGYGLLVGEPDPWEASHGRTITVRFVP